MSQQHIARTVTWTSNGTTQSTTMYEAQYSSKGPYSWRRWYTCHICGLDYPSDEVVLKGGTAFCTPLGCYHEINKTRNVGIGYHGGYY